VLEFGIFARPASEFDPFVLHLFAALAQKERSLISARTKEGLKAAKARGAKLGGWTAGSEASKQAADELAARMKPILMELSHLPSARQLAAELNRRGIKSATGGQWSSKTVVRLRQRLSVTINGTLCTISPEMKCTSRDDRDDRHAHDALARTPLRRRSSFETIMGPAAFLAALMAAAS
jgi:hypothetical protein